MKILRLFDSVIKSKLFLKIIGMQIIAINIYCLWAGLEELFYGEVQPRMVDNIIGIILLLSLYFHLCNWIDDKHKQSSAFNQRQEQEQELSSKWKQVLVCSCGYVSLASKRIRLCCPACGGSETITIYGRKRKDDTWEFREIT